MKNESLYFDIVIVGGGAAGLAAAIEAGCIGGLKIAVLEKKDYPGQKLSITGNGKCNISNINCENAAEVAAFFANSGILTRTDNGGRLYPYSEEAGQVTEQLINVAQKRNVKFFTGCQVMEIESREGGKGFAVSCCRSKGQDKEQDKDRDKGENKGVDYGQAHSPDSQSTHVIYCSKLLIATGGKSYAKLGSSGDGYKLAKIMGHKVNRPIPSLVPVLVKEDLNPIGGVRAKAGVRLLHGDKEVFAEQGEIQFNKDSISGIPIMNMSKYLDISTALDKGKSMEEAFGEYGIIMDFAPDMDMDSLTSALRYRSSMGIKDEDVLRGILKQKLAHYVIDRAKTKRGKIKAGTGVGIDTGEAKAGRSYNVDSIESEGTERNLGELTKCFAFTVKGTKGWSDAQVTRGGVDLNELNMASMESKLIKGLYFAGEVTDYDGPCGGYNLHYAWLSGSRAGKDMAKKCIESIR